MNVIAIQTYDSVPGMIETATRMALDAFFARVECRALRMAQIVTRDRDDALDIVQDSMIRLVRRYSGRPEDEWPPLFYRILGNCICDWQRQQVMKNRLFFWNSRTVDGESEDPVTRAPDPGASVEQHLAQREAMGTLEAAVRKLPRRQREAFLLRIWEGLNVEQAARAMGCSGGSVKTHLSRALAVLRAELQEAWP
ncbi:MAG: RNA polymerase sigma factor [Nevskiales bacterium]|nr:RNA polymerase sigma factor [Nevskiales bacterium]